MNTIIGIIVYGAFALGYVLILALTERSAARYVAAGCPTRHARTTVVLTSAHTTPGSAPAAAGASTVPLSERAA